MGEGTTSDFGDKANEPGVMGLIEDGKDRKTHILSTWLSSSLVFLK